MIANPIIRKEVLSSLRTRKAVAMQVLFLLVAALLIWRNWPPEGLQDIGSQQARTIFSILAVGQLAMIALFAPAFTAASLTTEREKNTLESLFCTAMKPWEIALGKMAGSLAFLLLLVLMGAPAPALLFLMGGIAGTMVLGVVGILLLTAVYLGMIGMLISTFMHRSYRAIIVTYGVLLVVFFLFALPAWPLSHNLLREVPGPWQAPLHLLCSLSPLEAVLSLVLDQSPYAVGAVGMPPFWLTFIPMSLAVIALTAGVCIFRLRRPIGPPRPREKLRVVERGKITARTFLFIIDPRKRKKMIRWWQNPILIKEFRTRPMLQAQWLLRTIGISLIVSILLMFLVAASVSAWVGEDVAMIPSMLTAVAALAVVLLILVGPAITGGAICSDRESGVWELIRTTRLSSLSIVSGKFQASIIPLLLLGLAVAPAMVVLLYFDPDQWPNVLWVLAVVGMTVLFVSTAGVFFSSVFSKTASATAATYGLLILMGVGSLMVLLDPQGFSHRVVRDIFLINPIAAVLDAAGSASMRRYDLVVPHLKIMAAATLSMLAVAVVRVFQLRRPE
jgi:ABC-type transport system involved in multi-copper enzyme maturation permease subunit